jgi:cytidine deaminase
VSKDLFEAAKAAMAYSHSPYSKFPVGAAIRAEDGRIYAGCNVENLSFPEGFCAEAGALAHMIMGGAKRIVEVAVIAEKLALCAPCGGCRQKLAEFAAPDVQVWLCDASGPQRAMTMGELLPAGFDAKLG